MASHPARRRGRRRRHAVGGVRAARASSASSSSTKSTTASYKQDESPRYHGRDVAVVRGRDGGRARRARHRRRRRSSRRPTPRPAATTCVALTQARPRPAARRPCASWTCAQEYAAQGADVDAQRAAARGDRAIGSSSGEQTLVLLNRRGFATVVFCRQCGASIECPHCSVSLTYPPRRAAGALPLLQLRGGRAEAVRRRAAASSSSSRASAPSGSRRICATRFPGGAHRARRSRHDSAARRDRARAAATSARGDDRHPRRHADDREGPRLSGGHARRRRLGRRRPRPGGFPRGRADVSAADAGRRPRRPRRRRRARRSSRRSIPITTRCRPPRRRTTTTFFAREMEFRRDLHYPPAVALINVVVKGRTLDAAMADAHDLVDARRGTASARPGPRPGAGRARPRSRTNTARSSSSRAHHRRPCARRSPRALDERSDLKRKVIVDVDPTSTL